METAAYEQEAERFLSALNEEYFQHGAGMKEDLDLAPIYDCWDSLFARDTVTALLQDRTSSDARYLAHFAASGLIDNILRGQTEQIATGEAKAVVEWDDRPVPYRQAGIVMTEEPDIARRHDLERRIAAVTARLNPERESRLVRAHRAATDLGVADYATMCDELCGYHLEDLRHSMQRLLQETEAAYNHTLGQHLQAAGVCAREGTTGDIAFVTRGRNFDDLFPKDAMVAALRRTLAGLGIDLDAQPNVSLDLEERPLKSPRAFCAPVRVPADVRLVIRPRGGHVDYAALFHEMGHVQHFACTRADAPFAFRCLGDNAITECYAFLFEGLLANRVWLHDMLGAEEPGAYLELAKLIDLYYLRRYAAKLHYELELHRSADAEGMSARYAEHLSGAVQVRVRPESFLSDVDDFFYCACYIRAWILEVHLRDLLVGRFGGRWYANRQAGDFLRDLWGLGQEYPAEEMAERLGRTGLDVGPLIADLNAPPGESPGE